MQNIVALQTNKAVLKEEKESYEASTENALDSLLLGRVLGGMTAIV